MVWAGLQLGCQVGPTPAALSDRRVEHHIRYRKRGAGAQQEQEHDARCEGGGRHRREQKRTAQAERACEDHVGRTPASEERHRVRQQPKEALEMPRHLRRACQPPILHGIHSHVIHEEVLLRTVNESLASALVDAVRKDNRRDVFPAKRGREPAQVGGQPENGPTPARSVLGKASCRHGGVHQLAPCTARSRSSCWVSQ